MNYKFCVLLFCILSMAFFIYFNYYELMENTVNPPNTTQELSNNNTNTVNSPNTTQELSDVYKNSQIFDNTDDQEGIITCLQKCKGNCVEFGVSGKAFCFI